MQQDELRYLLEDLRALPHESEWVEFKQNKAIPENIGEYLSALSNSACLENKEYGYLVFGIENETHEVKGTDFYPKKRKVGNQELENWLATLLDPRIDFKIFEFELKEKHIVIFQVDVTLNTPIRFKGIAWVRVGSYLKPLKDHPEKERKIWLKARKTIFEKQYAKRNISGDAVLSLIDYPGFFRLVKQNLPANKNAILDKLCQERLVETKGEKFHITNLGAILFAVDLNKFEGLERKAPRVIIYKGNNKLKTEKEHTESKGFAVGFEGLLTYLNDMLPTNEEIGRVFREEVKIYPELAIREIVANAIIHQDFNISGMNTMIEIFNNRIEITNPGKPMINTDRFIDHSPISRNEMIAGLMRRMGICEERGSGIDKVIENVEVFQLPAPEFISGDLYTRVILYAPKTHRQMSKPDKIRACYQHCCLKYVSGEYMTNQTLRQRFDIDDKSYPIISRIIRDSINEGLISEYEKSRMYVPYWVVE